MEYKFGDVLDIPGEFVETIKISSQESERKQTAFAMAGDRAVNANKALWEQIYEIFPELEDRHCRLNKETMQITVLHKSGD